MSKSFVNDANVLLHMILIMRTTLMIPNLILPNNFEKNISKNAVKMFLNLKSFYIFVTYMIQEQEDMSVDPLGNFAISLDILL